MDVGGTTYLQEFARFGYGGSSDGGTLQLTGHERDHSSVGDGSAHLPDYFHARYYDPRRGRFLSIDRLVGTLSLPQSLNRYAYVANTPLYMIDPSGLCGTRRGEEICPGTNIITMRGSAADDPVAALNAHYAILAQLHAEDVNRSRRAGYDTYRQTRLERFANELFAKIEDELAYPCGHHGPNFRCGIVQIGDLVTAEMPWWAPAAMKRA